PSTAARSIAQASRRPSRPAGTGLANPIPKRNCDFSARLRVSPTRMVRYTNAKVVLVGDSGVGKSGLGLVLSQQPFAPTLSTHSRYVWTFDSQEIELPTGRK